MNRHESEQQPTTVVTRTRIPANLWDSGEWSGNSPAHTFTPEWGTVDADDAYMHAGADDNTARNLVDKSFEWFEKKLDDGWTGANYDAHILAATAEPAASTANGAPAYSTTGDEIVDLFFACARGLEAGRLVTLLANAWALSPLLTLKCIFQTRDCRGGKGEKQIFRDAWSWLEREHPETARRNIDHIPEYGTYKDLYTVGDTLRPRALRILADTLLRDLLAVGRPVCADASASASAPTHINTASVQITLAAKWAPSENDSYDRKHKIMGPLLRALNASLRALPAADQSALCARFGNLTNAPTRINKAIYRKCIVTPLRNHLKIVETAMCKVMYDAINYAHVPSRAALLYAKAFNKHDSARYTAYLADVRAGKQKINARVHPHEIVQAIMASSNAADTTAYEMQWRVIADRLRDSVKTTNTLALVDVSGSMAGLPMSVSIALGLLLAETATGAFADQMITFSETPSLVEVDRKLPLRERVRLTRDMPWGANTDFIKVFELLLQHARLFKVPARDMPQTLYVFSDMQFDAAMKCKVGDDNSHDNARDNAHDNARDNGTPFEIIDKRYRMAGYERPHIVFWNLNGAYTSYPVQCATERVTLLSGFAPEMFKFVYDPLMPAKAVVEEILNAPRYARLVV